MASKNPFPESAEKQHLRRLHLADFAKLKIRLKNEDLVYFGLPSSEMLDVKTWKPVLGRVTAVERDKYVAETMYQTAWQLGLGPKTVIIENDIVEALKLLSLSDDETLGHLTPVEEKKYRDTRHIFHSVFNIDLYGGFFYPRINEPSENMKLFQYLIKWQARHKKPFLVIVTFNLRDQGNMDETYDKFIKDTLKEVSNFSLDISDVQNYYLAENVRNQPPNLRRLRFCIPTYLQHVALESFQVINLGAWYYKTFYHAKLWFEPRLGGSALGITWPPLDEFKELLKTPMKRIDKDVNLIDLPAPCLP
jgi:hypothetical protein